MEYQRIKYFITAAQAGSFSAAAKKLFISPQSVAKQIGLMEEELGVQLFDRVGRNVILNEAGKFALVKFRTVDTVLDDAIRSVRAFSETKGEKIRIGFFHALPKKSLITPVINSILTELPDIGLQLEMVDLGDTLKLLMDDKLDIAFTNLEETNVLREFNYLVFARKPAKIVVAPKHPWYQKEHITREDLKKESILMLDHADPGVYDKEYSAIYERIPYKDVVYVSNFSTMYTLLEQGKSFAVFPNIFANVDDIKFRFFDIPDDESYFLTTALCKKHTPNKSTEKVWNLLQSELSTYNL
ncbi:MAG: LysR family transcriptional regulator [Hespellia sp.]|nr:LysR family transcriptional regulator [Hespellia sp.]